MAVLLAGSVLIVSGAVLLACPWKPRLPVVVSYRTAWMDSSLVAQIHNDSDSLRKVLFVIESPTTGQIMNKVEVIPARGMAEVGWLEGWRFVSGERVRVHQAGYRDYDDVVP